MTLIEALKKSRIATLWTGDRVRYFATSLTMYKEDYHSDTSEEIKSDGWGELVKSNDWRAMGYDEPERIY